ncbi:MutS protein msh5 [Puccinia graminis f. sp. tritici]|uniref:MutS protein msh5 n=1 Tax=Puccinia graminis f. sp. tritici TaxID=56615 RepID=A0A5B0RVJ3_PUCGR|nr:MutS protein msh5 [Puccinia graminis f. sp. tritici]
MEKALNKHFAFAVNGWKNTMGGAYYDPSNGIFYLMEDAVDTGGEFEVLIMLLEQVMPEVVLLSSKAEESLTSCIQKAECPGGIDKTPTVVKRPSREYSASDGFKKLQRLSVRSQDGVVPSGNHHSSSTSTRSTASQDPGRDIHFSKNSNLTANAFINVEASHYSVGTFPQVKPLEGLRDEFNERILFCQLGAVAPLLSYLQSGIARDQDNDSPQGGLFVSKVEMIKTQK